MFFYKIYKIYNSVIKTKSEILNRKNVNKEKDRLKSSQGAWLNLHKVSETLRWKLKKNWKEKQIIKFVCMFYVVLTAICNGTW